MDTKSSYANLGIAESTGDDCKFCEVRACGMCSALSENELSRLHKMTQFRHYRAGEQIFCDDEPNHHFAAITSGIVKLSKILPDGRQQTIGLCFPPDFIGRAYKAKNSYYANAVTAVTVCTFPHNKFETFLLETPTLEHKLFELTLDQLDEARDWMLMLGRKTAIEKVATFLIMVATRIDKNSQLLDVAGSSQKFELQLTRTEIADFLGLTIETVSRQFSLLKQKGLIQIENQRFVEVLDMLALKEVAGMVDAI